MMSRGVNIDALLPAVGEQSTTGGCDVELTDIGFAYSPDLLAVSDIDIRIGSGRICGIVGPSGCGKSTLLFLLAGLLKPSAGTIRKSISDGRREPRLSMVFQKDTLLPWLTVEANIRLPFKFRPIDKRVADERVRWLLEVGGLQNRAKAYPYELSGGMRRRTAFLSAVAAMPDLLLLDEPFSALDEPTRIGIHQVVYETVRRLGTTVVLVTHDLAEAASMCDEIFVLSRGPGRIAEHVEIAFGAARDMLSLRKSDEFLTMYGSLWESLSRQLDESPRPAAAVRDQQSRRLFRWGRA
jgi:NitT/TauT family transport system ATP-binding protein